MQSRLLVAKPASAKAAAKPAAKAKPPHEYFASEETEVSASPAYNYSLAGMSLFAPAAVGDPGSPPLLPMLPWPIQAKLEVGSVDDPLEREADRVAEQVMRMPEPRAAASATMSDAAPGVQRKCSCGGSCDKCKAEQSDEEHGKVQRKPAAPLISRVASSPSPTGMAAPPIIHEVLRSPGQPLDAATRAFFEPRFGYDFGHVRIYKDDKATESAGDVHARAYTVGANIVFGKGQFTPPSRDGLKLLGHELSHVVQQSTSKGTVSGDSGVHHALMRNPEAELPPNASSADANWIESRDGTFAYVPKPGMNLKNVASYVTGSPDALDELAAKSNLSTTAPLPAGKAIVIPVEFINWSSRAFREMSNDLKKRIATAQSVVSSYQAWKRFVTVRPGLGIGLIPITEMAAQGASHVLQRPFEALGAFLTCLVNRLDGEEARELRHRIGPSFILSIVAFFAPGVLAGAAKELPKVAKQVAHVFVHPIEALEAMGGLLKLLFSSHASQIGCAMGEDFGEQLGKQIGSLLKQGDPGLAYGLGELAGPLLLNTLLSLIAPELIEVLAETGICRQLLRVLKDLKGELKFLDKWRKTPKSGAGTLERDVAKIERAEEAIVDAEKYLKDNPPGKVDGVPGKRHAHAGKHELREVKENGHIHCRLYSPPPGILVDCPEGWGDLDVGEHNDRPDVEPRTAKPAVAAAEQGAAAGKGKPAEPTTPAATEGKVVKTHPSTGGNRQLEVNGQRWNLPKGQDLARIPAVDNVGDQLQAAAKAAASEWNASKLTAAERQAIADARAKGESWRATLLERQARGRYVEAKVRPQFPNLRWSRTGVDAIDPATNLKYDVLSGTESNMTEHAKRMSSELFRMITF